MSSHTFNVFANVADPVKIILCASEGYQQHLKCTVYRKPHYFYVFVLCRAQRQVLPAASSLSPLALAVKSPFHLR